MSQIVDSQSNFLELASSVQQPVLYRCSCGCEFAVDRQWGGICPACQRRIDVRALSIATSATMTLQNIDNADSSTEFAAGDLDLANGTMLGHFRLEKPIGRGGMGAVYRAFDMSLQRHVAVKVIKPGASATPTQIEAMLREAVAQARLNHPNVVTIYYVGRQQDEPFLAMEYVDGKTLAELIQDWSIDYRTAIRITLEIVSALEHASHFGIVHGDIKPSNLLVNSQGHVKLSDFGLARLGPTESSEQPIAGTPLYVAPELLEGALPSSQSDMYALGVALFEMVIGRAPFELQGSTLREKLATHKTAEVDFPVPWPKEVPREFAKVVQRLLAKTPEQRFESYADLRQALKAIQPFDTTDAGIAGRAMAYGIDQAVMLVGYLPFAGAIYYAVNVDTAWRPFVPAFAFIALMIPIFYLLQMRRTLTSLGRYLFQLRICEDNGLTLNRNRLLIREILRSSLAIFVPLGAYESLHYEWSLLWSLRIVALIMVVELTCLLFLQHRRTLHDVLCRSKVVLKVETNSD